jgi:protease II
MTTLRRRIIRRCWWKRGLTDPRVTYWEPAKWVARLRATATGGGPIVS